MDVTVKKSRIGRALLNPAPTALASKRLVVTMSKFPFLESALVGKVDRQGPQSASPSSVSEKLHSANCQNFPVSHNSVQHTPYLLDHPLIPRCSAALTS